MSGTKLVDECACEDGLVGMVMEDDLNQDIEYAMLDEAPKNLNVDVATELEERCRDLEEHFVKKVVNPIVVNAVGWIQSRKMLNVLFGMLGVVRMSSLLSG